MSDPRQAADADARSVVGASYRREEMGKRLGQVIVPPQMPIFDALKRLNDAGTGVLLLAEDDRILFGIVTDGDIRRHLLANAPLTDPCSRIASRKPLVGSPEMTEQQMLELLDRGKGFAVNHLPVVTADNIIHSLVLREDITTAVRPRLSAVIMAGGAGTRLRPLTESVPKPMLPVGDRPLLERTIERLHAAGIVRVNVTTHYLAEQITNHFGDGQRFGVQLEYVTEDRPLGTAGALRLIKPPPSETLLVINGDVLTRVDFQRVLDFHREQRADATLCVRKYELEVPYGVVACDGPTVTSIREKPMQTFLVNAGIYLLEPDVLGYIPPDERFDMTDLMDRLLADGRHVVSFPIVEYWLDVGRLADYERAQVDVEAARL